MGVRVAFQRWAAVRRLAGRAVPRGEQAGDRAAVDPLWQMVPRGGGQRGRREPDLRQRARGGRQEAPQARDLHRRLGPSEDRQRGSLRNRRPSPVSWCPGRSPHHRTTARAGRLPQDQGGHARGHWARPGSLRVAVCGHDGRRGTGMAGACSGVAVRARRSTTAPLLNRRGAHRLPVWRSGRQRGVYAL